VLRNVCAVCVVIAGQIKRRQTDASFVCLEILIVVAFQTHLRLLPFRWSYLGYTKQCLVILIPSQAFGSVLEK